MSLTSIFDIAASGMSAQSVRLNTTASNIANAESVSSSEDETYRARHPVFAVRSNSFNEMFQQQRALSFNQPLRGVEVRGIIESDETLPKRYEPGHPLADQEGYVTYPNVNVVEEMANMISASRAFQTNVDIMESAKKMMEKLLNIGK